MGHIPSGHVLSCLSLILLIFPVDALRANAASEPKWLRISSDHFTVLTDGSEKQGREVAIRLEQMRWVFGQLLMKSKLKMSEPLTVIAFKEDKEYAQIAPVRQGQPTSGSGFFIEGEDRNYIVLNLFEPEPWRAIAHPFAHLFLDYNYPPTQPWFDEGFAEYFSSLRVDNKQVQIGGDPELGSAWHADQLRNQTAIRNPPRSLTELLAAPVWLAVPDLFTMRHDIGYPEGAHHTMFYAQSWMAMHYLLNKNKLAETGNYFDLVENQQLPVDQAVQQAYGMSVTRFDQAIKDYFHSLAPLFAAVDASKQSGGNAGLTNYVDTFPVAISADDVGTSRQDITEASARALVAEMALRLPEHRDQATHQLETLVNDPKMETAIARRALGWLHLQKKEFEQATEELNRALEIDPKDVFVHYQLALVKYRAAQASGRELQGLPNMIQDLHFVVEQEPDFAEAYNMLAMARLEGGGIHSATEAMRLAIQLTPRNQIYLLNMTRIYMAGKQWESATALLERLKTSPNPQIAHVARKNLEDLPTLKKYGRLPQAASEGGGGTKMAQSPQNDEEESEQPIHRSSEAPDKRPVQFLKGQLISVDCTRAPAATLTVTSGNRTLTLRTGNYKTLVLLGSSEFSCGWKHVSVAVNFKPAAKNEGDLVSLEVQ